MQVWSIDRRLIMKRLAVVACLSLMTFIFTSLGGASLIAANSDEDLPLTRAENADDRVALTFDVTWGKDELGRILAVLDAHQVKATFFVGGTFLSLHPETVKQIALKGHELGTLGQKIMDLSGLPEQEVTSNLLSSQSALSKALGAPVRYFRPPQGPATASVVRGARAAQLITVTHSVDSGDYLERSATEIARRVVRQAAKGDIIHLTASDWSKETARALPAIIKGLQEKRLRLVRVSELVPQE